MDRRYRLSSLRSWRGGVCLALLLALPVSSEAGLFRHKRHEKPRDLSAAPAQVLGIMVEPLREELRLQIDCSAPVRFRWGTLDNPHGFYVDLDGAQIAHNLQQLSLGTGVSEIRSTTRGPDQVRIALGLREGVTPRVERSGDGRSITLHIENGAPTRGADRPVGVPAAPGYQPAPPNGWSAPRPADDFPSRNVEGVGRDPASGPPLPEAPPVPEQTQRLPRAPEPLPSAGAKERDPIWVGPRVTGVEVENLSAAEALVRIHVDGALSSWRPFRLSDPPRLVMEFPGARHGVASLPRFTGAGPLTLGSVWSGQFTQSPAVARVVIRLPRATTPYTIEPRVGSGDVRVRIGSPAAATAVPVPSAGSLHFRRGFRVGIDPGHGGSDPGALNPAVGVCEKNITLDIARRLARLLEESGVRASLTRHDDRRLEITERKAFVSQGDEDVFVSIHCDAIEGRPGWTGITTYFHGGSMSGRTLAAALQSGLPTATGLPDRGVRADLTRFPGHGFYVLREARMPAVLIECGYVSHGPTAQKMKRADFRQQVAEGIAEGLRKYWEVHGARAPVASRR